MYALADPVMRVPVHPHERGAVLNHIAAWLLVFGSSPRAWGSSLHGRQPARNIRFIPTSVGQLRFDRVNDALQTVHPHERGAVMASASERSCDVGSSPRAWGSCERDGHSVQTLRFIPTSVGQLFSAFSLCSASSVHPHERGAVGYGESACAVRSGSSPRAWGSYMISRIRERLARFIPTSVGQFPAMLMQDCRNAVHPHERGAVTVICRKLAQIEYSIVKERR